MAARGGDQLAAIGGDIIEAGVAIVRRSVPQRRSYDALYALGLEFFAEPAEVKYTCSMPSDRNTGYTPVGVEYSTSPEIPDQKESITYVSAERAVAESQPAFVQRIYAAMRECADAVHPLAMGVMLALARRFGSEDAIYSPDYSQLALNSYVIAGSPRDLLIEPHEDGCLLTILSSTAPGLELKNRSGDFVACNDVVENFVIIPGHSLMLASSGVVAPTFHQVVHEPTVTRRYTIAYDVTADLSRPIPPWTDPKSDIRIDHEARLTLTRFGLAPLGS